MEGGGWPHAVGSCIALPPQVQLSETKRELKELRAALTVSQKEKEQLQEEKQVGAEGSGGVGEPRVGVPLAACLGRQRQHQGAGRELRALTGAVAGAAGVHTPAGREAGEGG